MPHLRKESKFFANAGPSFVRKMPIGLAMKMITKFPIAFAAVLLTSTMVSAATSSPELNCDREVENFTDRTQGAFPDGFVAYDESKLKKVIAKGNYYSVKKDSDSNSYLNAVAVKDGLIIHKDIKSWNLDEYPYLRWRWRAKQFPKAADERYIRSNDAAASVYVVWEANPLMKVKSIKFTWSSTLDVGTYLSKRFGLDHVQVLQNQKTSKGEWQEETVDVRALYRKYFEPEDGKLAKPLAVALLSDSDATDTVAEADYDDFTLCRDATPAPKPASVAVPKRKI